MFPKYYPQYDYFFRRSSQGKICLTIKAIKNSFEEYYQNTTGFYFLTFNMKVNVKIIIKKLLFALNTFRFNFTYFLFSNIGRNAIIKYFIVINSYSGSSISSMTMY